jgi:Beta-lactamase associated winged helix domain
VRRRRGFHRATTRRRFRREAQRALGVSAVDATPRQVVELVYADVDPVLWPAAEWSVPAQLAYLAS